MNVLTDQQLWTALGMFFLAGVFTVLTVQSFIKAIGKARGKRP